MYTCCPKLISERAFSKRQQRGGHEQEPDKAGRRARRLDNFDFEELAPEETKIVPLTKPDS